MCTSQKEIEFFQLLEIDLCAISQLFRRFRLGVRQKSEIESRHHLPTKALDPSTLIDNLRMGEHGSAGGVEAQGNV